MSLSTRYISDFLAQNKTVTLEKIGTLSTAQVPTMDEEGTPVVQPLFVYNKKAETTPEFIDYLAEVTQKSHSIAQSDLEYFLDQARQLMNIGSTPLVIEGLGNIFAEKNGEYALNTENIQEVKDKEKKAYEDNYSNSPLTSATNYATHRPDKRVIGRWVLILLIIGIIIYGAYFIPKSSFKFFSDGPKAASEDSTVAKTVQPVKATPIPAKPQRKEGVYLFVFQSYPVKADAEKRLRQLESYGNIVSMDSVNEAGQKIYRLFVKMEHIQAADTVRIKDSLHSYYGHTVTIE